MNISTKRRRVEVVSEVREVDGEVVESEVNHGDEMRDLKSTPGGDSNTLAAFVFDSTLTVDRLGQFQEDVCGESGGGLSRLRPLRHYTQLFWQELAYWRCLKMTPELR
eukprot:GHVN01054437.1.p2 GENE.GHVN01054437.1~~GHVN01054437.1.p2  ORF type:complete len:108 (-),score=21.65 GHVN01054437.1:1263-1586(-)